MFSTQDLIYLIKNIKNSKNVK